MQRESYTLISFQMIGYGECGLFLSKHTTCVCVCMFIGVRMRKQKALLSEFAKMHFTSFFLFSSTSIRVRNSPLFGKIGKNKTKKLFFVCLFVHSGMCSAFDIWTHSFFSLFLPLAFPFQQLFSGFLFCGKAI